MEKIEFKDLKKGFYCAWTGSFILIKEINSKDDILVYLWEHPALKIEKWYFSLLDHYINKGMNGKKYNIPLNKKNRESRLKILKGIFNSRVYDHRNG